MKEIEAKVILPKESTGDAFSVRKAVFQVEQGIDENIDLDGQDIHSTHVVVYDGDIPIGTGRVRKIDDQNSVKIERIAVLINHRSKGIGRIIMEKIHEHLVDTGVLTATLDAQAYAKPFYEKLGYMQIGDEFQEVGIPHVRMTRTFLKGGV